MGRLVIFFIFSFFIFVNPVSEVRAQSNNVLFSKKAQSKKTREKAVKAYKKAQKQEAENVPKEVLRKQKEARKNIIINKQKHLDKQRADVKARIIASEKKTKMKVKRRKKRK